MSEPLADVGLQAIQRTLSNASLVGGGGHQLTDSERRGVEEGMDAIRRHGYSWLWWCVQEIHRLQGNADGIQEFYDEAKAEVEKLKGLAATWERKAGQTVVDKHALQAEVERLRGALGHARVGLVQSAANAGAYSCGLLDEIDAALQGRG